MINYKDTYFGEDHVVGCDDRMYVINEVNTICNILSL